MLLVFDLFWLVAEVSVDQNRVEQCFENLVLSYRGSERQPPHVLSLALTFSRVMQDYAQEGRHPASWNTEERLANVVQNFNSQDSVLSRWAIDEDRQKAILNLLIGTSEHARQIISGHLAFHKWKECSFTSELLKSTRWLQNALPKGCKHIFKKLLVVDEEIQEEFLKNHVAHWIHATRKSRPSAKSKFRPSQQEWDKLVSYTCIMVACKREAKEFYKEDTEKADEVVTKLNNAFMSRLE
jgi:hypothetical protein